MPTPINVWQGGPTKPPGFRVLVRSCSGGRDCCHVGHFCPQHVVEVTNYWLLPLDVSCSANLKSSAISFGPPSTNTWATSKPKRVGPGKSDVVQGEFLYRVAAIRGVKATIDTEVTAVYAGMSSYTQVLQIEVETI